jgi:homoprotocatechuate degradation regulator HpaR
MPEAARRLRPEPAASPGLDRIEDSLAIMLLRAREAVMRRFRPLLAEHRFSEQQWRVLRVLSEDGPTEPTVLAERCVVMAPSLTRILAALEARGLVERSPHPTDGRRSLASITPGGRAAITRMAPASRAIYAELEAEFGAERVRELLIDLRGLAELRAGAVGS